MLLRILLLDIYTKQNSCYLFIIVSRFVGRAKH